MLKIRSLSLALLLGIILSATNIFAASYNIDPFTSSVMFKAEHLGGYTLGVFRQFGGTITLSDDNSQITALNATIDLRSVYTRSNQRDQDLQGPELFDAQHYPTAQFISKKIDAGKIIGDLSLKGKTKEVALEYTLKGVSKDQAGEGQVTLLAKGAINRKDFGVTYNRKLDSGKFLLGDEVTLEIEVIGKGK